jgi:transposase
MKKSSKIFVGMDVHKESIDITLAEPAGEVRRWGQIGGERAALAKAVRKLESLGQELHFVYGASPFISVRPLLSTVACAGPTRISQKFAPVR